MAARRRARRGEAAMAGSEAVELAVYKEGDANLVGVAEHVRALVDGTDEQRAFVAELGPQCGFCTPGQIMSAVALLAMSGNLCRCGAYDHYLNSVMRAAREA